VRALESDWISRVDDVVECWKAVLLREAPQSVRSADRDASTAAPVRPPTQFGSGEGEDEESAGLPRAQAQLCGVGTDSESIMAEDLALGSDAAAALRALAADWGTAAPEQLQALVASVEVLLFAGRTYQDEQDRMVAADIPLVAAAVVLMIVYVALVLGDVPPVKSRVTLAMVCVMGCVGGSLAISFGLGGYTGVPFNTLS